MMLCVLLAPLLFCTVRAASTGDCGPVPIVPHATALSNDTRLGSRVRYVCTEGYVHTGLRIKNICRRGGWSNNVRCSRDEISSARSCQRTNTDEFEFEYGGVTADGAREQFTCLHAVYAIGEDPPHNERNYVTCVDGSFVPTPGCRDTIPLAATTTQTITEEKNKDLPMFTTETTPTTKVTQRSSSCARLNTDDYTFSYRGRSIDGSREAYTCTKTGYIAEGQDDERGESNYVTCQNGWFEPSPKCKAPPCLVPSHTTYMRFLSTVTINAGGQVGYQCLFNAKARDGTTYATSTCTEAQWNPRPLCNPRGCDRGMALYRQKKCVGEEVGSGARNIPQDTCIEQCYQSSECTALVYHNNTCTMYRSCTRVWASSAFRIYQQIPRCQ